jgi:hypothetical protein
MKIQIILSILILIIGCGGGKTDDIDRHFANEIVLLDVSTHGRADIAREIDSLAKFKAKVIGLTVMFTDSKDSLQDDLLRRAIANASNVILQADLDNNDEIILPFAPFFAAASGIGLAAYGLNDENYCDRFFFLYQDSQTQLVHVAGLLASRFNHNDKTSIPRYKINSPTPFPDLTSEQKFNVLDSVYSELDVQGKIVILGILANDELISIKVDGAVQEIPVTILTARLTQFLLRD